jgi:hypothetical protein
MVRPGTIEVAPFGRTCEAVAIHSGASRRWTGKAIAVTAPSFRPTAVALASAAPIVGRASEAVAVELAPAATSKTLALEVTPAGTSETVSVEARAFGTACEALALKPSAFGAAPIPVAFEAAALARTREAIEPFTIESTARWRSIETIAVEAATLRTAGKLGAVRTAPIAFTAEHGTGRPTPLESRTWRTSRTSTFERCGAWTSRTTSTLHTFMDRFGERHELVFAQLAIFVLVELFEQLGGIWRLRASTAFATALICCALFFAALGAHLFVGVEFFQHSLAPFSAAIVAFLAVLLWRLGEGRQGQRGGRN